MGGHPARVWLFLLGSVGFFPSWSKWFAFVVFISSVTDFIVARRMDASSVPRTRKLLLTLSIVVNLGLLCFFKYTNFFLGSIQEALRACGAGASFPTLELLVPIGISFYTFEAIS